MISVILTWCTGVLAAFVASALVTAALPPFLAGHGIVDPPTSGLRGTPRGGGLAIVGVVIAAAMVTTLFDAAAAGRAVAALLPAVIVAAISWRDDIRSLPALARLGVHLAAAALAVALLGPARRIDLGPLGGFETGLWAWPLSLLWIVGMTNAFNFMDGIDGIAGITTMAVGAAVACGAALTDALPVAALAAALGAGAAGFLTSNWPPARIYMGDVGSTFCGFLLATLPLAVAETAVPRIMPLAALASWPFLFDTALALVRRASRRENLLRPHRDHLYQRLVDAGWTHRAVSSLYGGLAAFAGMIAVTPLYDAAAAEAAGALAVATPIVGGALLIGLVIAGGRRPTGPAQPGTGGRRG